MSDIGFIKKYQATMNKTTQANFSQVEVIKLRPIKADTALSIPINKMTPIGKISFTNWKSEGTDSTPRLLVKPRYRRMHDYDMWIDMKDKLIFVDNSNNCSHFDEEFKSVIDALGCPFTVVNEIPKESYKFIPGDDL